jgi:hypothetical protein
LFESRAKCERSQLNKNGKIFCIKFFSSCDFPKFFQISPIDIFCGAICAKYIGKSSAKIKKANLKQAF